MNKFSNNFINLDLTLFSGQTFSWNKIDDICIGSFRDKILIIKKVKNDYYWQTYPEKDNFEFVENYFDLSTDHSKAVIGISIDEHLERAVKTYSGLIILNQDFEQSLLSFILAQNKNIKAIRKALQFLASDLGRKVKTPEGTFNLFPDAEYFLEVSDSTLKQSGVGYRAKYLKDVASHVLNGLKPELEGEDRDPRLQVVIDRLKQIHGVGDKVADCVSVFGLGYREITPIDVWGDRILKDLYQNNELKSYNSKRNWFTNKFGKNTALAGQYLFEYIRNYRPESYYERI